jgi:hypothetical protein
MSATTQISASPTKPLTLDDVAEMAAARGWRDDSQWTPRHISQQLSRTFGELTAAVTTSTEGAITWSMWRSSDRGTRLLRRGTAPDVETALNAVENAHASARDTLF